MGGWVVKVCVCVSVGVCGWVRGWAVEVCMCASVGVGECGRVWVGVRTCLATRLEAQTSTSSYACLQSDLYTPAPIRNRSGAAAGACSMSENHAEN